MQEDARSQSLEQLKNIRHDIIKSLERYHAPGTRDPLRFIRQRTGVNVIYDDEQVTHWGNAPVMPSVAADINVIGQGKFIC